MIKRIFETHLDVSNLEESIKFYRDKLGLNLGHSDASRDVVFFGVGEPGETMLGLWKIPEDQAVDRRHFAFEVDLEFLKESKKWLEEKGIETIGSQGMTNMEPFVQAWMPAASLYFLDPDGNKLEFISRLPNKPRTTPDGKIYYLSEWEAERW